MRFDAQLQNGKNAGLFARDLNKNRDKIDKYHYFTMNGTCTTITAEKSPTAM